MYRDYYTVKLLEGICKGPLAAEIVGRWQSQYHFFSTDQHYVKNYIHGKILRAKSNWNLFPRKIL